MAERRLVIRSVTDEAIAWRAAIATMVVAIAIAVLGPVVWAIDLIILLATGAQPNVSEGPGVSTVEQWRGLMPIVIPWWVFLLPVLAVGILVAVTWPPGRHLSPVLSKGVLLTVGPGFLAFWALLASFVSLSSGVWYEASGYGLYLVPGALAAAVVAVAFIRWFVLRLTGKSARKRRPRARTS